MAEQGAESAVENDEDRMLYLDCQSGIAGDMLVAALLDAGADEEVMRRALDSLPVDGFSYEVTRTTRSALDCCDFRVTLDDEHENHDHDDEYLYGGIYPPRGPEDGRGPGPCPPAPPRDARPGDCPPPPPEGRRPGDCPPPPPPHAEDRRPGDYPPPPPPPPYGYPYNHPYGRPPEPARPPAPRPEDCRRPGDCPPPPPPEGRRPGDCPPPPPPEGGRPGDCPPPPPPSDGCQFDGPDDRGTPHGPGPDPEGPRPCCPGPQGPDAYAAGCGAASPNGHPDPHGPGPDGHGPDHGHPPGHGPDARHHHEHRGLSEVEDIINVADMTDGARELALRTFRIVAEAESKAHGVPVDQVHFHEVGAVDSIVDVVAASALLDSLRVDHVVVPVLVDGHGFVRCQHGVIPVPVPATLNICTEYGLPLAQAPLMGELVTPTGAALVAALEPETELPERYVVDALGLGAGKRDLPRPSILRAMLIHEASVQEAQPVPAEGVGSVCKLECDIDDATGEQLAYAADRLREAGALEVHWLPVYTKKNRPAYQLQVICCVQDVDRLELTIFRETTTLGIRCERMDRSVLERAVRTVDTPYGPVHVKCATLPDGTLRSSPEYDDCAAIAAREGVPFQQVMDAARDAAARS